MKRRIIRFQKDEVGDWVAVLEICGHKQHMRHNPPFVERPWVLTAEGREQFLGFELGCLECEEKNSDNPE